MRMYAYPCVKRCSPYCASTRPTASRVTTHSPEARRHRPVSAIRMGIGSSVHYFNLLVANRASFLRTFCVPVRTSPVLDVLPRVIAPLLQTGHEGKGPEGRGEVTGEGLGDTGLVRQEAEGGQRGTRLIESHRTQEV